MYVNNLVMAQKKAFEKQKSVEVVWRKYRITIHHTGPPYNISELRRLLIGALQQIMKIHRMKTLPPGEEEEYQVICKKQEKEDQQQQRSSFQSIEKSKKKLSGYFTDFEVR